MTTTDVGAAVTKLHQFDQESQQLERLTSSDQKPSASNPSQEQSFIPADKVHFSSAAIEQALSAKPRIDISPDEAGVARVWIAPAEEDSESELEARLNGQRPEESKTPDPMESQGPLGPPIVRLSKLV